MFRAHSAAALERPLQRCLSESRALCSGMRSWTLPGAAQRPSTGHPLANSMLTLPSLRVHLRLWTLSTFHEPSQQGAYETVSSWRAHMTAIERDRVQYTHYALWQSLASDPHASMTTSFCRCADARPLLVHRQQELSTLTQRLVSFTPY